MPGFQRSVLIARPVAEVFDFATDLKNAAVFLPNVTAAEMLTEGGPKPGARFKETRRMKGKERSVVIEIVEHDRPRVHAARAAMLGMEATYTFHFAQEGAGTRVDMIADVQGNLLWKLFLGMMARTMETEDGAYLDRLKAAMEKH